MKHILFYQILQKKENMLRMEVFEVEILLDDEVDFDEWMWIYEIYLNNFFEVEEEVLQEENHLQVLLEKILKQCFKLI
jgi:hypothetical protein